MFGAPHRMNPYDLATGYAADYERRLAEEDLLRSSRGGEGAGGVAYVASSGGSQAMKALTAVAVIAGALFAIGKLSK